MQEQEDMQLYTKQHIFGLTYSVPLQLAFLKLVTWPPAILAILVTLRKSKKILPTYILTLLIELKVFA